MPRHPESNSLCRYIRDCLSELLLLSVYIEWPAWTSGDNHTNGLKSFEAGFFLLGLQLAHADGSISECEAGLLADVQEIFSSDFMESACRLSNQQLRDGYRDAVRRDKELFGALQVPGAISHLNALDEALGTKHANKAKAMYFRFANSMLKADGKVTPKESQILSDLKDMLYSPSSESGIRRAEHGLGNCSLDYSQRDSSPSRPLEELLKDLDELIGLDAVKADVRQLVNFLRVQQMRESSGMASVAISRHLVFYGNPGTGKTTVARLLAQIYRSMGLVSRGHLVETDRSGLVAGYVGQTALKVKDVVNRALGGVLFVDEAYSLAAEGQDYGQEAIDSLIKLMEDNREDLIVVVAGYTDKMGKLLDSNPGLRSRFNKYFAFEDYTPQQLTSIFDAFCVKSGFKMTASAKMKLLSEFQVLHDLRDETFGNARLARNLFEKAVHNQANRIIAIPRVDEKILSTIEAADIPGSVPDASRELEFKEFKSERPAATTQAVITAAGKIAFKCPECAKTINAAREHGGKRGTCPRCGSIVIVPVVPGDGQLEV